MQIDDTSLQVLAWLVSELGSVISFRESVGQGRVSRGRRNVVKLLKHQQEVSFGANSRAHHQAHV